MEEMFESSVQTRTSGFFQISASIDKIKHVFVYLKKAYRNADNHKQVENSPYTANTYALDGVLLSNCRLEYGNGVFYPEIEYDSDEKVRIFNDLMAYEIRKNGYDSGTQLNLSNYNALFPLIYYDLNFSDKTDKIGNELVIV